MTEILNIVLSEYVLPGMGTARQAPAKLGKPFPLGEQCAEKLAMHFLLPDSYSLKPLA